MPKKKLIDKKTATRFHVVPRCQRDPLIADETASKHVLVPVANQSKSGKCKEEEAKYGIYADDDYNYLKHLLAIDKDNVHPVETTLVKKPRKEEFVLPSSIFASEVEENVGLLNKAAPEGLRLDLDPDVIAAMEGDFGFADPDDEMDPNNLNDEDIKRMLDLENVSGEGGGGDDGKNNGESDFGVDFDDDESFSKEETKSRFTDYSMSSSVMTRNSNLTLIDEKFEEMYGDYDEIEIGALDCDDIEGSIDPNSDLMKNLADEFKREREPAKLDVEKHNYVSDSCSDSDEYLLEVKGKEKWDCESVISTYSNIYNHPKLIVEPKVNKIKINEKTGLPLQSGRKLTKKALAALDFVEKSPAAPSVITQLTELSIRDKKETTNEKRDRKRKLKEYRRERREERKANSVAFKNEHIKMELAMIRNKSNPQGKIL